MHDGNIDISEIADNPKQFYGLLRLDRLGTVNYFPVGTSIVALPFAFVGTMVGASELEIAASAANTIAALSAVVLFMLANNLGGGISKSLFIALLFALGTSQLSIHAGGLWSHNVVVLMSFLTLYVVTLKDRRWILVLPFILFLGYLSRPDFSLIIAATIAYLLIVDREKAIQVIAILSVLVLGFLGYCYASYGSVLPEGVPGE